MYDPQFAQNDNKQEQNFHNNNIDQKKSILNVNINQANLKNIQPQKMELEPQVDVQKENFRQQICKGFYNFLKLARVTRLFSPIIQWWKYDAKQIIFTPLTIIGKVIEFRFQRKQPLKKFAFIKIQTYFKKSDPIQLQIMLYPDEVSKFVNVTNHFEKYQHYKTQDNNQNEQQKNVLERKTICLTSFVNLRPVFVSLGNNKLSKLCFAFNDQGFAFKIKQKLWKHLFPQTNIIHFKYSTFNLLKNIPVQVREKFNNTHKISQGALQNIAKQAFKQHPEEHQTIYGVISSMKQVSEKGYFEIILIPDIFQKNSKIIGRVLVCLYYQQNRQILQNYLQVGKLFMFRNTKSLRILERYIGYNIQYSKRIQNIEQMKNLITKMSNQTYQTDPSQFYHKMAISNICQLQNKFIDKGIRKYIVSLKYIDFLNCKIVCSKCLSFRSAFINTQIVYNNFNSHYNQQSKCQKCKSKDIKLCCYGSLFAYDNTGHALLHIDGDRILRFLGLQNSGQALIKNYLWNNNTKNEYFPIYKRFGRGGQSQCPINILKGLFDRKGGTKCIFGYSFLDPRKTVKIANKDDNKFISNMNSQEYFYNGVLCKSKTQFTINKKKQGDINGNKSKSVQSGNILYCYPYIQVVDFMDSQNCGYGSLCFDND